jgi:hypothetical protein
LRDHPLFSESALARLLDNVGRHDYKVNTMDIGSHNVRSRREGEIRGLSGQEVLEAVRTGRIWILLLRPDKRDSAYRALLHDIYAEMRRMVPNFKVDLAIMGAILISSPNVQVLYHCDIPGQTLWQVRGQKRVYVYPNKPPFLKQDSLEKIALRETQEFLPYEEGFDAGAVVFDLQPGQMLHWPLNAPHRIVNGDCVNASFTTEHFTPGDRRSFFVNYANGILRNRFGRHELSQKTSGPSYWAKLGLAAAYKFSGNQRKHRKVLPVDFIVDPKAPQGLRTVPAHELR